MAGETQGDIDADEQRLVGDGIEIGAKLAVPAKALGDEAVGSVREACEQKQQEGCIHLMSDDQPHHQRNEDDPPECEAVWDIHQRSSRRPLALLGAAGPPSLKFSRFDANA